MLTRLFTEHPQSVGESYGEHMVMAGSFGLRLLAGALVCFVHALLPFLFVKTGSSIITDLHRRMVTQRDRRLHDKALAEASPAEARRAA